MDIPFDNPFFLAINISPIWRWPGLSSNFYGRSRNSLNSCCQVLFVPLWLLFSFYDPVLGFFGGELCILFIRNGA